MSERYGASFRQRDGRKPASAASGIGSVFAGLRANSATAMTRSRTGPNPRSSRTALDTFGLLDPTVGTADSAVFARRGGAIMTASDDAPGSLGLASRDDGGDAALEARGRHPGHVAWGAYVLPDVPAFAGHDRQVHIATLSLWRRCGPDRAAAASTSRAQRA